MHPQGPMPSPAAGGMGAVPSGLRTQGVWPCSAGGRLGGHCRPGQAFLLGPWLMLPSVPCPASFRSPLPRWSPVRIWALWGRGAPRTPPSTLPHPEE